MNGDLRAGNMGERNCDRCRIEVTTQNGIGAQASTITITLVCWGSQGMTRCHPGCHLYSVHDPVGCGCEWLDIEEIGACNRKDGGGPGESNIYQRRTG